jgi:hypothetical protein
MKYSSKKLKKIYHGLFNNDCIKIYLSLFLTLLNINNDF